MDYRTHVNLRFNPCFFGSGVLSCCANFKPTPITEFQSLFFWKWGFKSSSTALLTVIAAGFNPCFFGSGVLRFLLLGMSTIDASVSILVFLEVGF